MLVLINMVMWVCLHKLYLQPLPAAYVKLPAETGCKRATGTCLWQNKHCHQVW